MFAALIPKVNADGIAFSSWVKSEDDRGKTSKDDMLSLLVFTGCPVKRRMTEEKTQCCEDKGGRMCKDNYGGGYCITSGCCSEEMNRHLETYGEDIGACYECNEETHRWVQESGMRFCPAFSNGYPDAPNSNRCVTSSYCCWNNKPFSCTLDGHWCTCYAPYWKETNLNNGKQIGDLVHDGSVSTAPAVAEYAF